MRDGVLGDLDEGFDHLVSKHGAGAARRWYWRQAIHCARFFGLSRETRLQQNTRSFRARLTGIGLDIRLAARAFARRPGYTLLLVATLGLGIGANATIFSFVNAILLTPLPFPDPDRLVTLSEFRLDMGNTAGVAPPTLVD